MRLTKQKIRSLITLVDERNNLGIREFYGINIDKEFMLTAANTSGLDESKYKLVRKNRFVYSGMQTGRDECIRMSMYTKDKLIIVSPAYTTFEVTATDKVLPIYFFMLFLSKEKDRLGWFYSDSSIRANLEWDMFCDIEINLPPLSVQRKYADIYTTMLENQRSYERGLDDLKLTFIAYIEELRRKTSTEEIRPYISEINIRNTELNINNIQGVNSNSEFGKTKADTAGLDLHNYKIVKKGQFAYNPSRINLGSIALSTQEECIVSPMYVVFEIANKEKLLPQYLMAWLGRKEFQRSTLFFASGSVRDTFGFDVMKEVKIPIPAIEVQQDIANIYTSYIMRKEINERLKTMIKDVCPVLIKGSLEEAGI